MERFEGGGEGYGRGARYMNFDSARRFPHDHMGFVMSRAIYDPGAEARICLYHFD